jgi:chorismate-pyruvate lyase
VDAERSLLNVFETVNKSVTPLSTFQRILLMTDGTVTDVLEAYASEPIRVVKLAQSFDVADSERGELDMPSTERVLRRSILLQGVESGTNFVYADSVLTPDHLHPEVLEGLLVSEKPLGRLIAEHRIETFREILALGFEPAGTCAEYFNVDPRTKLVFRTYRIMVGQRPVVRITEKFPVTWFQSPSPNGS